jgi:uncharacterized protein (DUF2147 family)
MKKTLLTLLFLTVVLLPLTTAAADNAGVAGYWKTYDDKTGELKSVVKIWEEGGKLKGRIEKIFPKPGEDPTPKCDKCSGSLKNVPVLGMVFLWDFKRDGGNAGKWLDGAIVDPENGKQYHCQLELADGGKKLEVFGYIRVIFKIGRTQVWMRAAESDVAAG